MNSASETETDAGRARRQLAWTTLGAGGLAAFVLLAGVLPAEFNRDPVGLGRMVGTNALWAPPEKVLAGVAETRSARSFSRSFRSDVVSIALKGAGDPERGDEVEYKVRLRKGAPFVYSWSVTGLANRQEFYSEAHGHTTAAGEGMTVAEYRKALGSSDHGVITAPFDGVHGWYFQNQSLEPVTVTVKMSGFYDLVPAGAPGNEAGLAARRIGF